MCICGGYLLIVPLMIVLLAMLKINYVVLEAAHEKRTKTPTTSSCHGSGEPG
jgi:hypothetical protein